MSVVQLTEFLGWCTLINVVLLGLTAISVIALKGTISKIHAAMFDVDAAALPATYFTYLADFKIAVLVLNVVPYIALRMMA